jgi:hypothetical protein
VKKTFSFLLTVHPRGDERKDRNWIPELDENIIAIDLNNDNKETLTVNATIYVGTEVAIGTFVLQPNSGCRYKPFMKRSELEADKDTWLPGGSLEIICKFFIFYPKESLNAPESAIVSHFLIW